MPRFVLLAFVFLLPPFVSLAEEQSLAPKLSPLEQRIEAALAKPVKWKFRETPLNTLVANIAKQVDLPISIDPVGLEEVGVELDQPVTLDLGTLSLRSGLQLLELQLYLTCAPTSTGLTITSTDSHDVAALLRIYPVADLVRVPVSDEVPSGIDYDTMIAAIQTHIIIDSWVDNGGQSSIKGFGGCLVVKQNLQAHHEISQFLTAWRKAKAQHAKLKPGESGEVVATNGSVKVGALMSKRHSSTIDMNLADYVQDVANLTEVPLMLDAQGLDEEGVMPARLIQTAYENVPILSVFRETLAKHKLAPALLDECVVVASEDTAREIERHTRFYPVSDLQNNEGRDRDTPLMRLLEVVEPNRWIDGGGSDVMSNLSNPQTLVVSATSETHEKVAQLLQSLRDAGAAQQLIEEQRATSGIEQRVYPLYVARRVLRAKLEAKADASPPENRVKVPAAVKPQFGAMAPPEVAEPVPSADNVAELIRELLPEGSWKEEGVLLKPFHDVLIIRHKPAMLRKIEKLLREIDAWSEFHHDRGSFRQGGVF